MEQFVGSMISIHCLMPMGEIQGQIVSVNPSNQEIKLKKVFCNGIPCPEIIIAAANITSLSILNPSQDDSVKIQRPIAKRPSHTIPEPTIPKPQIVRDSPRKQEPTQPDGNRTPSKRERQRQRFQLRDEAAFGSPMEQNMSDDFDFEKNLALFNKKAVYEEINASKPDVVRQADTRSTYRCDENILSSKPAVLKTMVVPDAGTVEYVTDSGLIVPSVSIILRNAILFAADKVGLTFARQTEMMGRAAADLSLQLLGGAHRLNPQNTHQCPSVAVLCGTNRSGVQGINCARHLASHGVRTTVYIENPVLMTTEIVQEFDLYKLTKNEYTVSVRDMLSMPIDLIILALHDAATSARILLTPALKWANDVRTNVLAIDPPPRGTGVRTNYSIIPVLPGAHDETNGKLYLCNLGIPAKVFQDSGIQYTPPFGPKFYIPLHLSE